jgi:DUF4097 and DUF4098 domain-containing protein YvlB
MPTLSTVILIEKRAQPKSLGLIALKISLAPPILIFTEAPKYCWIEKLQYCSKCGRQLPDNSNFCPFCGATVETRSSKETHNTFKVSGNQRLVISNKIPGSIEVKSGNPDEVIVDFDLSEAEYLEWSAFQDGNLINVRCKAKPGTYWPAIAARADIKIRTPKQSDVDVECNAGGINLNGIQGRLLSDTLAGSIRLIQCDGSVQVRTKAGSIELDHVNGNVSARNLAGSITFQGTLSNGESSFMAKVGNIDVKLSGEPDLSIDASSRVGRVNLDSDLRPQKVKSEQYTVGHRLRCDIGNGTNRLFLETYTGNIGIRKAI